MQMLRQFAIRTNCENCELMNSKKKRKKLQIKTKSEKSKGMTVMGERDDVIKREERGSTEWERDGERERESEIREKHTPFKMEWLTTGAQNC